MIELLAEANVSVGDASAIGLGSLGLGVLGRELARWVREALRSRLAQSGAEAAAEPSASAQPAPSVAPLPLTPAVCPAHAELDRRLTVVQTTVEVSLAGVNASIATLTGEVRSRFDTVQGSLDALGGRAP